MKTISSFLLLFLFITTLPLQAQLASKSNKSKKIKTAQMKSLNDIQLKSKVAAYLKDIEKSFENISTERKEELEKIAAYVHSKTGKGEVAALTFICTHNSRRSHFAQIWAAVASAYYKIPFVQTFSGGTEATAFNPRSVAALERAGFEITKKDESKNPKYDVYYADQVQPIMAFSKKYDEGSNPKKDFCAVMTCSQADEACPIVRGAALRIAIPYEDPKAFDNQPEEGKMYDERCRQIATEMFYLMSKVK